MTDWSALTRRLSVRIVLLATTFCAMILLGVCLPASATAWGGAGHITGTVTAADDGPLRDVYVGVYQHEGDWSWEGTGYTDESGTYDVGGLSSGYYIVAFYDSGSGYMDEWYDDQPDYDRADPVWVTDGDVTSGIDAVVARPGHIKGTVTGQGDGPLADAWVESYWEDSGTGDWLWVNFVITDESGTYDMGGLRAGRYRLQFTDVWGSHLPEWYDDAETFDDATALELAPGATLEGIDAELDRAGHISGTVSAEGDGPLPGIHVEIYKFEPGARHWYWHNDTGTSESGTYLIGGLPEGDYKIGFRDESGAYLPEFYDDKPTRREGNVIQLARSEERDGVDAELRAAGHIAGTVTDAADRALPGIGVQALSRHPGACWWDWVGWTYTSESGTYDMGGLATGSYRVGFWDESDTYVSEWYDDERYLETADDVAVTAGLTTDGIDAQLSKYSHIRGRVTDEQTGDPLAGIMAEVSVEARGGYRDWAGIEWTNESGTYDVGWLRSGTHYVQFRDETGTYAPEWYDDVSSESSATSIRVLSGKKVGGIDAELGQAGHIRGTVTNESDEPLSGIHVEGIVYNETWGHWNWVSFGETDESGTYDLGGLLTGTHKVQFWDESGTYLTEYYDNQRTLDDATGIPVVTGSATENIDAVLSAAGHITGAVRGADGPYLSGIGVSAHQYDEEHQWWDWRGYSETNESGTYDINGLDTGDYRVQFLDETGTYLTQYYDGASSIDEGSDVSVVAGHVTGGIDAILGVAGHVTGVVTDEADGEALSGIRVVARVHVPDDGDGWWSEVREAYTDESGNYNIGGLDTDDYRIQFRDESETYATEWYNNQPSAWTADGVHVDAGATHEGIDAALDVAARICGKVTSSATGEGLAHIRVTPIIHTGSPGDGFNFLGSEVWTDESGTYCIGGLAPGKYRVGFQDDSETYLPKWYEDAEDPGSATDVDLVSGGARDDVDVALDPVAGGTDTTAPVGSVLINGGSAVTSKTAATLSLDATDPAGSGVRWMRISNDGVFDTEPWLDYAPTRAWTLGSGDGTKMVSAVFRDRAGNTSIAYSDDIVLDTAAPAGTFAVNEDAARTATATVTLDNTITGATWMRFRNAPAGAWSDWEAHAATRAWTLPAGDGTKTVDAEFADAAGNVLPLSDSIMLDTVPPVLTLTSTQPSNAYGVTASLTASLVASDGPITEAVVELQKSADGVNWTADGTLPYSAATGNYEEGRILSAKVHYRARFPGDAAHAPAMSPAITLMCQAYLRQPNAPSVVRRYRTFTVYGYLKPRHSGYTRLYFQRYYRRAWRNYRWVNARNYNYASYTKYVLRYRVPYAGSWRVRAYHADASHLATYSAWERFRAR